MQNSTLILDHHKIDQKINRIAYQIYEDNYNQDEIIMAGIAKNGFVFASILKERLETISNIKVILKELTIDKKNPIKSKAEVKMQGEEIKNKSIVVVDDVLNSGKTMMYGLQAFLNAPLKSLSIAVLVNRSHKRYPVNANYVGMSLATTLKEHIEVSFEKPNNYTVTLS
ncbi:MAG: phosphoribosyltransferase [Bacteroidetes bacterium]|nr:MAG: phosphoribosyltransferase [Bacteroidota bacterium]MBL1144374.1 phosphoribosyltransferase [Bacteroidota bacterium]NOG57170.1 phosphoribosyltransferase [Bacteroidota bacterium]